MPKIERHFQGKVTLADTTNDETFSILKAYFGDVKLVDKYPLATITFFINESLDEVLKNDQSTKISKRKIERVRQKVLDRLKGRYGKWINLLCFEQCRNDKIEFVTNFTSTYKTEKGIIYGHSPNSKLRQLFFTSHSLKRFDERIDEKRYHFFYNYFKRKVGVFPTSLDILSKLIICANQFGVERDFRYINVFLGALVVEAFRNIFIVKTFLTPDMLNSKINWFELDLNHFEIENGNKFNIDSIQGFFDHKSISCKPIFLKPEENLLEIKI